MADNKDSYTYKKYKKNKILFSGLSLFIFLVGLWMVYLIFKLLPIAIGSPILLIFVAVLAKIGFSFLDYAKQDVKNLKKSNYYTWGKGAGAELAIANTLAELDPSYKVVSDFNTGRGNIDFILIGPKGIYTIEVKAHKGSIRYFNRQLTIDGKIPEKDYIRQTNAEMIWLTENLRQQFKKYFRVTGLLEFPNGKIDINTIHGPIDNIWIGGYKFHNYLLHKSNNFLAPEEIEKVYAYLSSMKNTALNN